MTNTFFDSLKQGAKEIGRKAIDDIKDQLPVRYSREDGVLSLAPTLVQKATTIAVERITY